MGIHFLLYDWEKIFAFSKWATFERGDMYDAVYKAIKGGAVLPEANIFSLALCLLWYNMLGRIYA